MKNQLPYIVTAVTLLFLSNVLSAQAPSLGRAASFVIFSSTGAIANTARTILTGNVGTNTGAITGFGNVNGVMHNPDTTTAGAKDDLLIAYNQLNAAIPTTSLSNLMGNGQTITAGVYAISGNTTLNLDLTLDGQADSNSVFIIQIQGTFSASTASRVILTSGAQACNVFWKVEGAVSIGTGATMRGNIIANNAAIEFMVSDTLEGRALTTTGQVSMNALTASIPTGCGSTMLSGPAAPALASTACYALFSGSGSVANGGSTFVTGDIGTNAGLTTGYNALNVNGTIHPVPDVSTNTCDTDLAKVYTYLNNLPVDINLLYPPDFGHNLVLTPHTYLLTGATTLTDTLYLNANGNANAVFVIKVTGAFSTTTFAKVLLVNGAQSKNVYWKIDGAVSLNNYAEFKGTIICNNGAVDITTGVILDGRALTTSGAFSTASINATIPSGSCSTLPLTWLYFRGKSVQNNVLLEWGTAREINNSFFTIEKSRNGNTFETLTTVPASVKSTNAAYNYSVTDRQPFSLSYYRISQTDNNGHKEYFGIIKVTSAINQSFSVLHYVMDNYIYIKASNATPGNGMIEVYNIDGKKMSTQKVLLTTEENTFKIEKPMQKGMYLLYIKNNGGRLYYGKVLVM